MGYRGYYRCHTAESHALIPYLAPTSHFISCKDELSTGLKSSARFTRSWSPRALGTAKARRNCVIVTVIIVIITLVIIVIIVLVVTVVIIVMIVTVAIVV